MMQDEIIDRLRTALRLEMILLREWVVEIKLYGWSTQHVEAMNRRADQIAVILAETESFKGQL